MTDPPRPDLEAIRRRAEAAHRLYKAAEPLAPGARYVAEFADSCVNDIPALLAYTDWLERMFISYAEHGAGCSREICRCGLDAIRTTIEQARLPERPQTDEVKP